MVQRLNTNQVADEQESGSKERTVSSQFFPYMDLEDAITVVQTIYDHCSMTACSREQLSVWLKHESATSGSFRIRLSTARLFGLIEIGQNTVKLTQLGYDIREPERKRAARVRAFLNVPIYRQLYERLKPRQMPNNVGLEQEMVDLGVTPKQKAKARQAFQRSAAQAGFFDESPTRLVMPMGISLESGIPSNDKNTGKLTTPQAPGQDQSPAFQHDQYGGGGGGSNGGGGSDSETQQFLKNTLVRALFEDLARNDIPWTKEQREEWIELAKLVLKRVHPISQQRVDQSQSFEGK